MSGETTIINPYEKEPISTEEVQGRLSSGAAEIAETLRNRARQQNYNEWDVQATIDYLTDKTELLCQGLLPADDHVFLSEVIEEWFGMAHTSARYANEIETSDRVIRRAVDAIQVAMVVNKLISEEAKAELNKRWPAPEQSQAAD